MLALKCENLTKKYANGFVALDNVNIQVEQGDFYALLGANGAGKSTLLGIVSSLVKKSSGQVEIFGKNTQTNFLEIKKDLGVVPQEFNFSQFLTPKEVLVMNAGFFAIGEKEARIYADWLLQNLNIYEKRDTQIRFLSGGMKRRVMIARALIHKPKLLLLDEPTAGVDIELRHSMWEFLQRINTQGTSIILTTHYLEEAELLCNKIGIIAKGKLIKQGQKEDLLAEVNKQSLILNLAKPLEIMPNLAGYSYKQLSESKLELEFDKNTSLNMIFHTLDEAGIQVASIQNKHSLLEELFFELSEETNSKIELEIS